jgi:hypothetical protein
MMRNQVAKRVSHFDMPAIDEALAIWTAREILP